MVTTPATGGKTIDPANVTSYITSIISTLVGLVSVLHPGFKEPAIVEAVVSSVSFAFASIVQVVNVITHRQVVKTAITNSK